MAHFPFSKFSPQNYLTMKDGQDRCDSNQYTCLDGSCIRSDWVCDGYSDCTGGVDESARVCGI